MVIVKDKVNALHSAHAGEHVVLRGLGLLEAVALGFGAELGHGRAETHQRVHQFFDVQALLMSQRRGVLLRCLNRGTSGRTSQHICSEKLLEHELILLVGGSLALPIQALDRLRAAEAPQAALELLEPEVGRLWDSHHVLGRLLVLLVLLMMMVELGRCRGGRLDCATCRPQEASRGEGLVADHAVAGLEARLRHVEVAILFLALLVDHEAGLLEENLVG